MTLLCRSMLSSCPAPIPFRRAWRRMNSETPTCSSSVRRSKGPVSGPACDPPHVVFQPVAVTDLDRVPRGLEDFPPTVQQIGGDAPRVGRPRVPAVAGVGRRRNAAQGRRHHGCVPLEDAFIARGGRDPRLRPANRLVPHPEGLPELFPRGFVERREDDALDVRLVHDLEELAHGVAAVRDFPREPLGDGRGRCPAPPRPAPPAASKAPTSSRSRRTVRGTYRLIATSTESFLSSRERSPTR